MTDKMLTYDRIMCINDELVRIYYNEDGNDGNGQFVEEHISLDIVYDIFLKSKDFYNFLDNLTEIAKTFLIDNDGSQEFENYKKWMYLEPDSCITLKAFLNLNPPCSIFNRNRFLDFLSDVIPEMKTYFNTPDRDASKEAEKIEKLEAFYA